MVTHSVGGFEELIAWQRGMDLAVRVYGLTREGELARDFSLRDQVRRAVISVPSNVAEGYERGTRPEFHRFLMIAKGSSGELRTQLHLAHRLGYIDDDVASSVVEEARHVSRVISKLQSSVARQRSAAKK